MLDLLVDVFAESILHGGISTTVAEKHNVFSHELTAVEQHAQAVAKRREAITAGASTRPSHNRLTRPATVGDGRRRTLERLRPQAWPKHYREQWGSGSLKINHCSKPPGYRAVTAPSLVSRRERAVNRYKPSLEMLKERRQDLQEQLLSDAVQFAEEVDDEDDKEDRTKSPSYRSPSNSPKSQKSSITIGDYARQVRASVLASHKFAVNEVEEKFHEKKKSSQNRQNRIEFHDFQ